MMHLQGHSTLAKSVFHLQNRKKDFKFLGMRLTSSDYFSVNITQDTNSIKELTQGVDSFSEEKKRSFLKSLVGQLLYLDLTQPDLAFMISDLSSYHVPLQRPRMKDFEWPEHYSNEYKSRLRVSSTQRQ